MRLGVGLGLTSLRGASFSPLSLAPLAFWDASAPGTVFQDVAGTIPATTDGQAVALLKDAYGRTAFDISFGSAAKRPLLRVSGGQRWLEFDGVDDSMATTGNVTLPVENTVMTAIQPTANGRILFELGPNATTTNGFYVSVSLSSTQGFVARTTAGIHSAETVATTPGLHVFGARYLAGAFSFERNGSTVSVATTTGSARSGDVTGVLNFGARNNTSIFYGGRFYAGGIFPASVGFNPQLRTWLGNKAGLSL